MTSVGQYSGDWQTFAETSAAPGRPAHDSDKSATRVDIALLASALFLQRFTLPIFGTKTLSLDLVLAVLIVVHQFAAGRLLIQYDRFLWFLVLALATTTALLLNFKSTMLTSYGLFLVVYFLFTLTRPSTTDQYKRTLQGFQTLVLILSCLAIAQFAAQFVVDGKRLTMFYWILPNSVLATPTAMGGTGGWNTIITIKLGGASLIKSNGIFLVEPSTMSQMAALAVLIEIVEFRRLRYLILLTLGMFLAYSGTGISILLFSLPLAVLVTRRAQLPALLMGLFAFGLLATGIIHLSAFTSRVGEFGNPNASAFMRFVSPFWQAADHFDTASVAEVLLGKGPGFGALKGKFYSTVSDTWFKLVLEYGLVGAFVFTFFLRSCFRRSRCPTPLIFGLIYHYVFTGNNLLTPSLLIIMVVLCTLNGPEPRRGRIYETGQYRPAFLARSAAS
jgi:hypothetical protein